MAHPTRRLLFEIEQRRVRRCSECTHVYLDVVHDAESIRACTPPTATAGKASTLPASTTRWRQTWTATCSVARLLCENHDSQLHLLDVGCGNGALLRQAQVTWFRGYRGVEISTALASLVKDQLRCDVYQQFLSELDLPESSFDVVTMYDLIEHAENPRQDLEHVFRVLKSGGVFFALTPNDQALLRRISRVLFAASLHSFSRPDAPVILPRSLVVLYELRVYRGS